MASAVAPSKPLHSGKGPQGLAEKQVAASPQNKYQWWSRVCLLSILLLGGTLRFLSLSWGLPNEAIGSIPFHPDELWAMGVLESINPTAWAFNPLGAHREGTLCYYLWTVWGLLLQQAGLIAKLPHQLSTYNADYAETLFALRSLNLLAELGSIGLLYLTTLRLTANRLAALFGALVFALTPFEIIYSSFLRTHSLSNFFLILTVFLSVWASQVKTLSAWAFVGGGVGLCFTARYPVAAIGIVPVGTIVWQSLTETKGLLAKTKVLASQLWHPRTISMAVAFLVTVFITDPFLFLDFGAALSDITYQASFAAKKEFSVGSLFDFSKLGIYLSDILPFGAQPTLWILFYTSTLLLLFRPGLYTYVIPMLGFQLFFLYAMGKGYLEVPTFIRTVIALFPLFALFSGLAVDQLLRGLKSRSLQAGVVTLLCLLFVAPTLAYNIAYTAMMRRPDPREQLHHLLDSKLAARRPRKNDLRLDHYLHPTDFAFIIDPALKGLKHREAITTSFEPESSIATTQADYILLAGYHRDSFEGFRRQITRVEATKRYREVALIEAPVETLGFRFDSDQDPADLRYPNPTFALFRKKRRARP